MGVDKENTTQSNLNSKYLRVTLVVKYPVSFICFHCVKINLLVKDDLILRYEAHVNALRASSLNLF